MAENKISDARIRANNKYNAKAYDRINIVVTKGKKGLIQTFAAKRGETLNRFVNRAIDEAMGKDDAAPLPYQ